MKLESRIWPWLVLALVVGVVVWSWRRPAPPTGDPGADMTLLGRDYGTLLGTVTGTIRRFDEAELAARVCLRPVKLHGEHPPRCTDTEPDGRYRLYAAPGRYELYVSAPEHAGKIAHLTIAAGTQLQRDFSMYAATAKLRGIVRDLRGRPLPGAVVTISSHRFEKDPADAGALAIAGIDGRFSADVRRGWLRIYADAPGHAPRLRYSSAPGPTLEFHLPPESVIVGRLVDAATREPIAGVPVRADVELKHVWTLDGEARSDADGYFRITGLIAGDYRPIVAHGRWRGRSEQPVHLAVGEVSEPVVVPLVRAAAMRVRVVDDRGEPACFGEEIWAVSESTRFFYQSIVGDDGEVEIGGLIPDTYDLSLFCNSQLQAKIASFEITREDAELDELRVVVRRGLDVRGVVVDARGEPLTDVSVVAWQRRGALPIWVEAASDAAGAFELRGLAPGRWALRLDGSGGPTSVERVEINLHDRGLDDVRVVVPPTGSLFGRVLDDSGDPVRDLEIRVRPTFDDHELELVARSDDTGRFELIGLAPAQYRVEARDSTFRFERGSSEVEIEAERRSDVELRVSSGAGTIRGRVVDERGNGLHAHVVLERESGASGHVPHKGYLSYGGEFYPAFDDRWGRPVMTEADGSFVAAGLPDGEYSVTAVTTELARVTAIGVSVGDDIELRVAPLARLSGQVITPEPGPLDFSLSLRLAGNLIASEEWSNADGRFRFEALPPGTYELRVESPRGDAVVELELAPGAELDDQRIELVAPELD